MPAEEAPTLLQMYCPDCGLVDELWDEPQGFVCPECDGYTYDDKEAYIDATHAEVMFQKEYGYGPWLEGDA